jgi:hypothetical protein
MPDLNLLLPCRNGVLSRLRFSLPLLMVIVSASANAQSTACSGPPVQIDETIAKIHSDANHSHPEYQYLEELSHMLLREMKTGMSQVQPIQLQVEVDQQGKTTSVTPVSGLHELSRVYVDWFNRITFVPFKQDGQPVCARFMVYTEPKVSPEIGPEFNDKEKFHSLLQKCTDISRSGASAADLVSACQQAADAGGPLPPSYFGKDKRLAYVMTATAMMRASRAKEALAYAEEAVQTADLGWDDVTGKASAYGVRGQARAITGDLKGASEDLAKAEELERATFEISRKPEQKTFDTHALKAMLGFHAEVLTALGKKPAADTLRAEAKKL